MRVLLPSWEDVSRPPAFFEGGISLYYLYFYSKDWKIIEKALVDYSKFEFLVINVPNLEEEKTELLFRYIGNFEKFMEMVDSLKQQGLDVSIKNYDDDD